MSFGWPDYLALAVTLEQQSSNEACLRSAVSRAYYASYKSAVNKLTLSSRQQLPAVVDPRRKRRPGIHQRLWLFYQQAGARLKNGTLAQIGQTGEIMRVSRTDADYEDIIANPIALCRNTIQRASEVLALLAGIPGQI